VFTIQCGGDHTKMSGEMKLLYRRLMSLKRFIQKHEAGYEGFRALVVSAGDRLGVARLEFTRESLEAMDKKEAIANTHTLRLFQGDASRIAEFNLEVTEAGLLIHLPKSPPVLARLPQARSTIHMSPRASSEYGIQWSTHSVEAWTPSGNLPERPDQQTVARLSGELHMDVDRHWGNALILMPRFEARLPDTQGIAVGVEAAIDYDSSLISPGNLVLVREIWEEGMLWDREQSTLGGLPTSKETETQRQVLLSDVASGTEDSRWVDAIRGDGGDAYVITLATRDGGLLDSRRIPLITSFKLDIEVSSEYPFASELSALKNPGWLTRERSEIDPNRPWKDRLPRDRFLGRPGVWLTKADKETVDGILDLIALRASEFVKVIDPHAHIDLLDALVIRFPTNIPIKVLTSNISTKAKFVARLSELRAHGYRIDVLRIHRDGGPSGTPLHDRYVVTSGAAWYLGTSFNSLATNASLVAEVTPADARRLEEQFDEWWSNEVLGRDGEPCSKDQL